MHRDLFNRDSVKCALRLARDRDVVLSQEDAQSALSLMLTVPAHADVYAWASHGMKVEPSECMMPPLTTGLKSQEVEDGLRLMKYFRASANPFGRPGLLPWTAPQHNHGPPS
jgi:hypothetical protein